MTMVSKPCLVSLASPVTAAAEVLNPRSRCRSAVMPSKVAAPVRLVATSSWFSRRTRGWLTSSVSFLGARCPLHLHAPCVKPSRCPITDTLCNVGLGGLAGLPMAGLRLDVFFWRWRCEKGPDPAESQPHPPSTSIPPTSTCPSQPRGRPLKLSPDSTTGWLSAEATLQPGLVPNFHLHDEVFGRVKVS